MGLCYSLPNQSLEKATLDTRPEFSLKGVHTYGKILRVYDGDTAWVSVNSPIATTWRVRLLGIDTEEMRQPKDVENREEKISLAFAARNRLAQLTTDVHVDLDCRLKSKDWNELIGKNRKLIWVEFGDSDKYGRPLVQLFERKNGIQSVNSMLVAEHYALEYDGKTKSSVTDQVTSASRM